MRSGPCKPPTRKVGPVAHRHARAVLAGAKGGLAVGTNVGSNVGTAEGANVGENEGCPVGSDVGDVVVTG